MRTVSFLAPRPHYDDDSAYKLARSVLSHEEGWLTDGKQLEALVRFIESVLVPQGFEIETRERVFDDEGRQIAEFDVTVRGKVGSTDFSWLIECRDRPSSGAAPGSWIEQLVGRRDRFALDKVTAVSTTGFAAGAKEYAASRGIELRELRNVSAAEFSWISGGEMIVFRRVSELKSCRLLIDERESEARRSAMQKILAGTGPVVLQTNARGEVTPHAAFRRALDQSGDWFQGLAEGQSVSVRLDATYPRGDRYFLETEVGPVEFPGIRFVGEVRIERHALPLISTARYERSSDQEAISQLAAFAPVKTEAGSFSLEFHRMGEDGETHVILRPVPDVAG